MQMMTDDNDGNLRGRGRTYVDKDKGKSQGLGSVCGGWDTSVTAGS